MIVAAYLGYAFYSDNHSICDINEVLDCTTVHQSDYAVFLGIPVAIIGFIGYIVILLISFFKFKYVKWVSLFGALFSLRLTWAEMFIIHKYCIFCLVSQAIIIAIFILSVRWKRYLKK